MNDALAAASAMTKNDAQEEATMNQQCEPRRCPA